jgi:hypothetical protein
VISAIAKERSARAVRVVSWRPWIYFSNFFTHRRPALGWCTGGRDGTAGVQVGPVACGVFEAHAGSHVVLGNLGILWVIRIWAAEEGVEGDERGSERERGRPVVLEDVEGYRA